MSDVTKQETVEAVGAWAVVAHGRAVFVSLDRDTCLQFTLRYPIVRLTAAPALVVGEPVEQYRFLDNGEIIASGDECPSDDCSRWEPVNRWAVGSPRSSIFKVIRRKIPHPSEALAAATERAEKAERERDEAEAEIFSTDALLADERRMRFAAEADLEKMRRALEGVLTANQNFRDQMPPDWEGDPLQDACEIAREALSPSPRLSDAEGKGL